ncbi:hypothetical protein FB479_112163 [Brevibacillus sp. AG162]|nr:hypothetical protein FB479_112163 [Brevibacillus sp. AG162]
MFFFPRCFFLHLENSIQAVFKKHVDSQQLVEETGEISEDLWTRFLFFSRSRASHAPVQGFQESERFLLFPPHHNSEYNALIFQSNKQRTANPIRLIKKNRIELKLC